MFQPVLVAAIGRDNISAVGTFKLLRNDRMLAENIKVELEPNNQQ